MSKRHYTELDYNDDETDYSDEEDEAGGGEQEQQQEIEEMVTMRARNGRSRKPSVIACEASRTVTAQMPLTTTNAVSDLSTSTLPGFTPTTQRRRGRGPSKRPCTNRNALMARENRIKKKKYIEELETKIAKLINENTQLNDTVSKQQDTIDKLKQEVHYLHNVILNSPEIEKLLRGINAHLGVEAKCEQEDNKVQTDVLKGLSKLQAESAALDWGSNGGVTNSSNTNNLSVPVSGSTRNGNSMVTKEEERRSRFGQNNTVPIARKTMPFTNLIMPKSENPSSVGSSLEDYERNIVQNPSSESSSYCEYNTDRTSSAGLDNQLPTTPLSTLSTSIGQGEATMSETDFSQISPFNAEDDDFFNFQNNEVSNSLPFESDAPDFINDDDFFNTVDSEIDSQLITDPIEIKEMCDSIKQKPYYSDLPNTGVCLHINSKRVTLEYCSICHLKHSQKFKNDIMI